MRIAALVLVGAVALALGGCAPASRPSDSPKPSATAVFASDDAALAAAEKAYRAYRTAANEILQDGGKQPERIDEFVTGKLLQDEHRDMSEFRAMAYKVVGSESLKSFMLQKADLGADPGAKDVISAYACIDISSVSVIDSAGNSVVSPGRKTSLAYEVHFDFVGKKLVPSEQDTWDNSDFC